MFDVTGLAVVANESHHRSVISSYYHGVGGAGGDAVRLKRAGLSTQPCGAPVSRIMVDDMNQFAENHEGHPGVAVLSAPSG